MNWDFRRWQSLDVELCLSLVCARTHLVPNKPEQCPASNCEGYSLPEPRVQWPIRTLSKTPLQTHSSVSSVTLWEGQRHITRNWGEKAISVAVHCLEKHQTAGHSPKGCSSWLWERCCDLCRDNIRATTEARFKTLTIKVWKEKAKRFRLNSYTASLRSFNPSAFGQRDRALSYSPLYYALASKCWLQPEVTF